MTEELLGDKFIDVEGLRLGVELLPKKWKGCSFAEYNFIKSIRDNKTADLIVWPDEGEFDAAGIWRFNEKHEGFEPLLMDMTTANMLVLVHEAFQKEENRAKFVEWIAKGRGHFAKIMEIGWGAVRK